MDCGENKANHRQVLTASAGGSPQRARCARREGVSHFRWGIMASRDSEGRPVTSCVGQTRRMDEIPAFKELSLSLFWDKKSVAESYPTPAIQQTWVGCEFKVPCRGAARNRDGDGETGLPLLELVEQETFVIFSDQHYTKYCGARSSRKEGREDRQKDSKYKTAPGRI